MHNFSSGRWIERRTQFVVLYSWTDAVEAFVLLHVISSLSVIFLFVVVVVGFFLLASKHISMSVRLKDYIPEWHLLSHGGFH